LETNAAMLGRSASFFLSSSSSRRRMRRLSVIVKEEEREGKVRRSGGDMWHDRNLLGVGQDDTSQQFLVFLPPQRDCGSFSKEEQQQTRKVFAHLT